MLILSPSSCPNASGLIVCVLEIPSNAHSYGSLATEFKDALGHEEGERINNLVNVMDGYFDQGAHHLNVNVFGKEKLIDAMEHPEKEEYANFTIRVSGYAVKFIDLTREQQMDVISRTCHATM